MYYRPNSNIKVTVFEDESIHHDDLTESEAETKWRRETDIISRVVARERQLRRPLVLADLDLKLFSHSEVDSISDMLPWLLQTKEEESSGSMPV